MKYIITLCLFLTATYNFADSPLTSTGFASTYASYEIVQDALDSDGVLTDTYCSYLHNSKNKLEIKLSIVNALSWDIDGKENFTIYLDYLIKHNTKLSEENYKKNCTRDQLICLAYLKALDNYNDTELPLELSELALKKAKKSYAVHIIHGLIKAQSLFSKDWCDLWKATDNVRQNKKLKNDFSETAKKNIFDYMDLYKEDCKSKK